MLGRFFVFACVVLLTGGTGLAPRSHAGEAKPTVFVSIVPQAYFVERIGDSRVEVKVMVQPGHSPATYEPTPRQMAALSEAKLYLRVGVPFEDAFLHKIERTMKNLKIVDTRKGIALRKMKARAIANFCICITETHETTYVNRSVFGVAEALNQAAPFRRWAYMPSEKGSESWQSERQSEKRRQRTSFLISRN